jgi:transposase InsO family protein
VSGWFEIAEIKDKTAVETSKIFGQCCYPQPLRCITDNENEFLGKEFQELLRLYGVQLIHTTIKNPQEIWWNVFNKH